MNHYQLRVLYENDIVENFRLTVGADALIGHYYRTDGVAFVGPDRVVTPDGYTSTGVWPLVGALAQGIWSPWDWLTLTAGLRFDSFGEEADPRLTPRAAVVWQPEEEFALKFLYGNSYLAPQWAHLRAGNSDFMGNPDLAPQDFHGVNVIAMLNLPDAHVTAELDLFYNRIDGLINAVRDPTGTFFSYQNVGQSSYYGGELSASWGPIEWLQVTASYSLMLPHVTDTTQVLRIDREIVSIPTHTWRYGLRVEPYENLVFQVWGRAYSDVVTYDPILVPTGTHQSVVPAVFLLDASVTYSFDESVADGVLDGLFLQVAANNLIDQYFEIAGTVIRPMPQGGISVFGTLGYRIDMQ